MGIEKATVVGLALAAGLAVGTASADEWDLGTDNDNASTTDNALAHGADQRHDLGAQPGPVADQDWYRINENLLSSYELLVDGMTGDVDLGSLSVQVFGPDGTTVVSSAALPMGEGLLTMRWLGGSSTGPETRFVRIHRAACITSCDSSDRYRVRFYDTTYTIPRFNNSGTQRTVLLIQNGHPGPCPVTVHFLSESGTLANSFTQQIPRYGTLVLPTAELAPGLSSGSIRIAHFCGYGGLSGKAVALEPSTGFTFETPMVARPY